jgi:hypothetical protein
MTTHVIFRAGIWPEIRMGARLCRVPWKRWSYRLGAHKKHFALRHQLPSSSKCRIIAAPAGIVQRRLSSPVLPTMRRFSASLPRTTVSTWKSRLARMHSKRFAMRSRKFHWAMAIIASAPAIPHFGFGGVGKQTNNTQRSTSIEVYGGGDIQLETKDLPGFLGPKKTAH